MDMANLVYQGKLIRQSTKTPGRKVYNMLPGVVVAYTTLSNKVTSFCHALKE